ncbi:hypothetical protein Sste5344_008818 [Sporothrix stenoceras]
MTPAYLMITTIFYKRAEQPLRLCLYVAMNGLATMVGALFANGLVHATHSHVASWRLIFITISGLNIIWGFVFLYFVPDTPMTARCLSHQQRVVTVRRVAGNLMGIKTTEFKPYQVWCTLRDPKMFLIVLMGIANFLSALTKGFGFTGLNATILQLPTGALELLAIVGSSWLLYTSAIAPVMSYNLLATNFAGHTKRATVNGLWFIFWAAGTIPGTYVCFPREAPRYFSAITELLENRRPDRLLSAINGGDGIDGSDDADDEAIRLGFLYKTDCKNMHFRYRL